jgi:hypothetical protein
MYRLSRNLGASTFWSPQALFRPVMGLLYVSHSIIIQSYTKECYGNVKIVVYDCIIIEFDINTTGWL